ncbi:MAG: hypothetical protein Q4G27_01880 [Flavobacteriaceae bacterium]|nr:hypothetical protein [Flavobacteriaceae bacterium]
MKKFYFLLVIALLASCNTLKRAEKSLNSGDYNRAFDILVTRYQKGLSDKKFTQYLSSLQEAYYRMVNQEETQIEYLRQTNNPANYKEIYERLIQLNNRQSKLKSLLPLFHNGKKVEITTKNYLDAIENAKLEYTEYLYNQASTQMLSNTKPEFRKAYYNFKKVNELIPGFGDVNKMLSESHFHGTDFILVDINNESNQMLPRRLENELLELRTNGLDDFWTEFHNIKQQKITYDYLMRFDIHRIMVSPERLNSSHHRLEKEIKDGWEYLYENGQQVRDSLGNPIKVDKYIIVRADLEEIFQEKDALVEGRVNLIDLKNNRVLDYERLYSQYGFRNHFARYRGDRRALDQEAMMLAQNRMLPFPSHEQMVYDCGEDLKSQLRQMLKRKF